MSSRVHPDFIQACSEAVGESNIPDIFRRWTALSAIAGALGRRCWINRGTFHVRPNMYIVLVAPPANNKSLSLNLPFSKVMSALSIEPGTEAQDNILLPQYDMDSYPLHQISGRITAEQLTRELKTCHRVDLRVHNDPEARDFGGVFNDSSLTLITGEFGVFMNRNDQHMQTFITEVWNSEKEYSYRTKNMGKDLVKGPCLNWIAGSVPGEFVDCLPENAASQGLLSRMLPIYHGGVEAPKRKLHYGDISYDIVDALRHDLADIGHMCGAFRFHDSILPEVESDIEKGLPPIPTAQSMLDYNNRRVDAHIFKVAMSVSAARSSSRVITREDWITAKEYLFEIETMMPTVLANFGTGKVGKIAFDLNTFLDEVVKKNPKRLGIPITLFRREVMRRVSTAAEVEQVVRAMADAGMIDIDDNIVIPK
tara:strand:+ start:16314 stop:17585 length:1272 start_codon:yes stop_codon:yes gene_type:complete